MKLSVIVLTLFCFAVTTSVFAFDYDFSDPRAIEGNNSAKDWKVISDTWSIKDGTYDQTDVNGNDGNAFRSIYQSKWVIKDGKVVMKVKHDAKSSGMNDAILLYRMEDDDNGYATRLQRDGYLTIGKITDGVYSHILYTVASVNADVVYTVTVQLNGDAIDAYLDNKLLVSVKDKNFSEGKIGLCVGRCAFPIHFLSISAEGDGIPKGDPFAMESLDKLATTWGVIKR